MVMSTWHQSSVSLIVTLLVLVLASYLFHSWTATELDTPSENALNRQFLLDHISAQNIEKFMKSMSSKPHLAGSKQNDDLGDEIERTWKEYGFITKRSVYDVLLSYPGGPENRNRAEILLSNNSVIYTSQTEEEILDPVQNEAEVVPPFNAFAKAATVAATRVFYVNYCRQKDFDLLETRIKAKLKGSIVLCRYGKIYRGNKVALAEQHGIAGVILYNDPEDYIDPNFANPTKDETFPNTIYLPGSGAQRGTVIRTEGDPLTPKFPSLDYVYRTTVDDLRNRSILPDIPTQPMGYEDAEVFLSQLRDAAGSTEVPEEWRGGITNLIYTFGGELADGRAIKIVNNNEEVRRNITNIFGIIKGSIEPDRYVLIGNHRDAWMFGAQDPISGTAIQMETARVFSQLLQTGWRPRRSVIFCSWDAGEYGLFGSVEWLEEVKAIISDRSVAYVNLDTPVMGTDVFTIKASPLFYNVLYETAKLISHANRTGVDLYTDWMETTVNQSLHQRTGSAALRPLIENLGAGADYSAFFHRVGITTAAVMYTYDKKNNLADWYPLYHTTYETFKSVKLFLDPTFSFHKSVTEFVTELTRNLCDSVIVPFVVSDYASKLITIHKQLVKTFYTTLKNKGLHRSLDDLKNSVEKFEQAAALFDERVRGVNREDLMEVRRLNDQLSHLERGFCFDLGVLDRFELKHVVFAPTATNFYTGTAFPGVVDSLYEIDEDDTAAWARVKEELSKAVYSVESARKFLAPDDHFW